MNSAVSPFSRSHAAWQVARLCAVAGFAFFPLSTVRAEGQESFQERAALVPAPGQVVSPVACAHDASQSYAVFLPSRYTPGRRWPVLFAFDPMGRGRVPVELFSGAAERLGYVVVGSNNSRNGPWEPATEAMQAMWRDANARFALDPRRVYTTGMSGGAAPATILAATAGAGVIACGAALTIEQLPELAPDHAWISVSGQFDFNFNANRVFTQSLVDRGVRARFLEFDGGHNWPPAEVAARALESIHISAMRTGRAPRDEEFIERYIRNGVARAAELFAQGRVADTADEWSVLARELAGLAPVADYEVEARKLNATPTAKKDRKRDARMGESFERRIRELLTFRAVMDRADAEILLWPAYRSAYPTGERADGVDNTFVGTSDEVSAQLAAAELKVRLDRLVRDAKSKTQETQIVAQRVLGGFFIETMQAAQARKADGDIARALVLLKLCARARPEAGGLAYEVARLHAARGESAAALTELKRARALGFHDTGRMASEQEWKALRANPEFAEIEASIRGT